MIILKDVCKKYGEIIAVNNINLEINKGEICVLLGPSGCGKSTTVRLINKLIIPSNGEIYIDDRNINDYSIEQLRRNIGYVVQSTGLFPHMTVGDNIAIVPRLLKWEKSIVENRVNEMLQLVGLSIEKYRKKYPHELSGGEAQRIGVARALAADPPIVLMDEPFGAVDPLNRKRLQNEFLKIQQELKKTVVFVTHDVEEAIKMGNNIAIMNQGKVEEVDTPEGLILRTESEFVKKFLGKEYAIKILSKYSVSQIMKNSCEDLVKPEHSLNQGASLQSALAYMIEKSITSIKVKNDNGNCVGEIGIEHIVNILKEIGDS